MFTGPKIPEKTEPEHWAWIEIIDLLFFSNIKILE